MEKYISHVRTTYNENYEYDHNCPPQEDRRLITSPTGEEVEVAIEVTIDVDRGNEQPSSKIHDLRHVIEPPNLTETGTYFRAIPGIDYSKYGWRHIKMTTFWRNIDGYWVPFNNTKRIQELKDYDNMSFCDRVRSLF